MKNVEKLERVLTRELVLKNFHKTVKINYMRFGRVKIKDTFGYRISHNKVSLDYEFTVKEKEDIRIAKVSTEIDLSGLDNANDSSQEQDILAYIVYEHINSLETKVKQELDKIDFDSNYIREVQEKVQKQLDNKNKFIGEFGFKDGNLYVTSSGFKYMNTPYKPDVLVTPDGLKLEPLNKTKPIPNEHILLGSLTLQEKDGKLAVTDKNGSTRFI
ncbi:hypothetical protein K0O13_08320 [Mammaliicoccus sciuri]|uniref:hypothetical protein n=1 Tax=Mammaliicoccus sciuri TaxID=1296 RepID=UPI001C628CE7|nr:hypothetical protein [Mammaliicoccus sciuri]QYG30105.1 hypothetical protein K0O13_08320 [Mammaliicoccus sciuri]